MWSTLFYTFIIIANLYINNNCYFIKRKGSKSANSPLAEALKIINIYIYIYILLQITKGKHDIV